MKMYSQHGVLFCPSPSLMLMRVHSVAFVIPILGLVMESIAAGRGRHESAIGIVLTAFIAILAAPVGRRRERETRNG